MNAQTYYCYQITHVPTGRIYFGKTNNPNRRRWEHFEGKNRNTGNSHLARAIKLYGPEQFTFEVVSAHPNDESACLTEEIFIALLDTTQTGFNIALGGKGRRAPHSDKTRAKFLKAWETRCRTLSDETRAKQSAAHIGLGHTEETKEKLRTINTQFNPMRGKEPWNKGRRATPEEIEKNRAQALQRHAKMSAEEKRSRTEKARLALQRKRNAA
jgi:predicted GIY-YIG superfamily endonuclease